MVEWNLVNGANIKISLANLIYIRVAYKTLRSVAEMPYFYFKKSFFSFFATYLMVKLTNILFLTLIATFCEVWIFGLVYSSVSLFFIAHYTYAFYCIVSLSHKLKRLCPFKPTHNILIAQKLKLWSTFTLDYL